MRQALCGAMVSSHKKYDGKENRMRRATAFMTAFVLALAFATGAQAQKKRGAQKSDARDAEIQSLKKEVESLREQQNAMSAELEEIKDLFKQIVDIINSERQPTVSVDDDPALGDEAARVVLIDFSDYQ